MPLGQAQQLRGQHGRGAQALAHVVEQLDLIQEPGIDPGGVVHLLDAGARAQQLLHLLQSAVVRYPDRLEQRLAVQLVRAPDPLEACVLLLQ